MFENKKLNPGDFCWLELASPDLDVSKTFYQQLFGWKINSHPMPNGEEYAEIELNGQHFAGAFKINKEMLKQGVPPHWGAYIYTQNVDEATKKAKTLGANIIMEPFDVMTIGRMSKLADPTGAMISLWQPKEHELIQPAVSTPGMFSWLELLTDNMRKAEDFYTQLFNWKASTHDFNGNPYTSFTNKEVSIAGMMEKQAEWGSFPNYWGVYFTVANFEETQKKAKTLGAKRVYEPMDIARLGKITMYEDPQGIHFSVIQFASDFKK